VPNLLFGTDVTLAATEFAPSSWLIIQNEVPNDANVAAVRIARQGRAGVFYNAAPARLYAEKLFNLVDILAVNALEAESLGSHSVASASFRR
jgi:ribokinase